MGLILNTSTVIRNLSIGPLSGGGNGGGGGGISTTGLQLHWDAAQYGGSGDILDQSGNSRNGQFYGSSISYISSGDSSYFDFNPASTNNYIQNNSSSDNFGLTSTVDTTISVWLNVDSVPAHTRLFGLHKTDRTGTDGNGSMSLSILASPSRLYSTLSNNHSEIAGIGSHTTTGVWVHYTLTADYSSTGTFNTIINGSTVFNSETITGSSPSPSNLNYFMIGTRPSTDHSFDGKWAHAAIYNRVLTNDEILSNYNALKSRYGY